MPIRYLGRGLVDGGFDASGAAGGPAWLDTVGYQGAGVGPGGPSGPAAPAAPKWPGVQGAPIPKVPSYDQYMKLLGLDSPAARVPFVAPATSNSNGWPDTVGYQSVGVGPANPSGLAAPSPEWPKLQGPPIQKVPSYDQYMKLLGLDSPAPDPTTPGTPLAVDPSASGTDGGWFARMMADVDPDDPAQFRPQPWTLQRLR